MTLFVEEDIVRFDISMNDTYLMKALNGQYLSHDCDEYICAEKIVTHKLRRIKLCNFRTKVSFMLDEFSQIATSIIRLEI